MEKYPNNNNGASDSFNLDRRNGERRGEKALRGPWTAEGFHGEIEEDRKKSQEELYRDHLERQKEIAERNKHEWGGRDPESATNPKSPAPYVEQKLGSATIRAARGYEEGLGKALGLDPNAWQEPSNIEDDSDKYNLEELKKKEPGTKPIFSVSDLKAQLERDRAKSQEELKEEYKEILEKLHDIERKIERIIEK